MFSLQDLKQYLSEQDRIEGNCELAIFDKVKPIEEADEHTIVWFKSKEQKETVRLTHTLATLIICSSKLQVPRDLMGKKCFIQTENPKLLFSKIVAALFGRKPVPGIHPTAVISSDAVIGEGASIGAHAVIDKCIIGKNCTVGANCHVMDNTTMGDNILIGSSTVIGGNGFGYSREPDGQLILFPHVGGVVIEDNVEIGSNTSIDRGALGDTVIKRGVKIDNLVHIAHNVVIEQNSLIIAHAMIGGSVRIGQRTWIAPSACLKNGIRIGSDVTVGLGAVVTKDIPDGETWVGNPAMPLSDFINMRKKG